MISTKRKYFLIGLLVGVGLVGVVSGFFLLQRMEQIEYKQGLANMTLEHLKEKVKGVKMNVQQEDTVQKVAIVNTIEKKTIITFDTVHVVQQVVDTGVIEQIDVETQEDSVILKDIPVVERVDLLEDVRKLVTAIEVIPLGRKKSLEEQSKDSLLAKVSGVRDVTNEENMSLLVELWDSPLNYRGYQMSRRKLVLYGLKNVEGIRLFIKSGDMFLVLDDAMYNLEYTDKFKPYEEVSLVTKVLINELID